MLCAYECMLYIQTDIHVSIAHATGIAAGYQKQKIQKQTSPSLRISAAAPHAFFFVFVAVVFLWSYCFILLPTLFLLKIRFFSFLFFTFILISLFILHFVHTKTKTKTCCVIFLSPCLCFFVDVLLFLQSLNQFCFLPLYLFIQLTSRTRFPFRRIQIWVSLDKQSLSTCPILGSVCDCGSFPQLIVGTFIALTFVQERF